MAIEQMDLFTFHEDSLQCDASGSILNGMYYDESGDRLVSFVLGRLHWTGPITGEGYPVDWQKRIRKERAIQL